MTEQRKGADPRALSNQELIAATSHYRILVAKGVAGADETARAHEDEMTRRFGGHTTLRAPMGDDFEDTRPWWRFWGER